MASPKLSIYLIISILLPFTIKDTHGCIWGNLGSAGAELGQSIKQTGDSISSGMKETGDKLGNSLTESSQHLSEAAKQAAADLSKEIGASSARLADAANNGIAAAKDIVKEMNTAISTLADSIDLRMDSGDLQHIGTGAAEQLKEAIIGLSTNWEFAVNTADLQNVGATAAAHLSKALQNINAKIQVTIRHEADIGIVTSIGYISIAVGVAFSVLFVAIVACFATRLPCCGDLCKKQNNSTQQVDQKPEYHRHHETTYGEPTTNKYPQEMNGYNNKDTYEPLVFNNHRNIYQNTNYP